MEIQAQRCQKKTFGVFIKTGQAKFITGAWNHQKLMVEKAISNQIIFFMKGGYSFRRFNCNRELIVGAAAI